jgi:hypothetical protein
MARALGEIAGRARVLELAAFLEPCTLPLWG